MSTSLSNTSTVKPQQETQVKVEHGKIWNVIVLNDPINLMSYVVMVFQKIFGYNLETAKKLMLEVHQQGRSLVWSGELEKAESYAHQLQQWQLTVVLEEHSND